MRAIRPVRFFLLPLALGALALPDLAAGANPGPGDLLVAPTRIVFEGRQRSAELTLVNTGARAATYRISFTQLRMGEDGGTKEIETPGPGERFADNLVRYSPREVTLEPGIAQTVRMQVRKPADLEPGEYRSHLRFRAVPSPEAAAKDAPEGVSIQLVPIYGVSVPVIVRHGETSAAVTLESPELLPASGETTPILRVRMTRTGNQSIYGNFTVTFTPAGGKPRVVGLADGVAVYTPNPVRVIGIPLRPPPDTILRNGLLHVTYTKPDKKREGIAVTELMIP